MNKRPREKPFAKKSLGQNFLSDNTYVQKIVSALNLQSGETVVEIGPGRGALTEQLVRSGANVIAIELDQDLVSILRDQFKGSENLKIIKDDVLEVDFTALVSENPQSKLVANLPYYISTAILQRLIEHRTTFSEMVLMLQREVVQRITAPPGNSERGFLTVLMEAYFDSEKLFDVPPEAFRPQPKVWSSVVRLKPRSTLVTDDAAFRKLISESFAQKRKTILNNLKHYYPHAAPILQQSGIEPSRRSESLTLNEWLKLASLLPGNG